MTSWNFWNWCDTWTEAYNAPSQRFLTMLPRNAFSQLWFLTMLPRNAFSQCFLTTLPHRKETVNQWWEIKNVMGHFKKIFFSRMPVKYWRSKSNKFPMTYTFFQRIEVENDVSCFFEQAKSTKSHYARHLNSLSSEQHVKTDILHMIKTL